MTYMSDSSLVQAEATWPLEQLSWAKRKPPPTNKNKKTKTKNLDLEAPRSTEAAGSEGQLHRCSNVETHAENSKFSKCTIQGMWVEVSQVQSQAK